jgi:hypothetical protein
LSSRVEMYLESAQQCEALASQEKDAVVKAALRHAAQQWRDRAGLLDQRAHDVPTAFEKQP